MNWEKSSALTALKRDFLRGFFARRQAFFLTGGSALGVFYLRHRLSYDMAFFTTDRDVDWHALDNDVVDISRDIAARCEPITADLVDLYFLHKRGFTVSDHFADARKKEGGVDPATISFLLANVQIDRTPDYLLEAMDLADLKRFVDDLRDTLAAMSFPEGGKAR